MIQAENLISKLQKNKIDFFTGVPDSILKNFSANLENFKKEKHVIATNEGSAVSIGIGYHLSTKKIPCIYFQNSGLSNAINPLVSIANKKVYSIPLLLIIGWRGSPNKKDEPQHLAKGKITKKLLSLLKVKYIVLRKSKDLLKISNIVNYAKKNKKIVAFLVEKDILVSNKKIKQINNSKYVLRFEFIKKFLEIIPYSSKIISTTGYTSRELHEIRKKFQLKKGVDFYMVGGMGHSSSVALGCSLNSGNKIFCLDGDGSALMHMGSLRTIGYLNKKNLKYIVLNNNAHESVGGQSTYAAGINFKSLSKSLGFRNFYKVKNNKNYSYIIKNFVKSKGPSLLEVKIQKKSMKNLSRPKNLIKIKKIFMAGKK